MTAAGIHAHGRYKLGRKPPSRKPALRLADVLTGTVPAHPVAADHLRTVAFGLDRNDEFGVCGPTSSDNYCRLVSAALLGRALPWTQDEVFALYRLCNPGFDPNAQPGADGSVPGDDGVDMQDMLGKWAAHGAGHDEHGKPLKPIAYAKVDVTNDDELQAAVAIFGGVLWGVDLQVAQQAQTDARPPVWDYRRSSDWGGHAIVCGAYEADDHQDVVSWAERIASSDAFRRHQLQEAWVVILPWHLDHPAFQQGVDVGALASAYKDLTGRDLPVPAPTPRPGPAPVDPPSAADRQLWATVGAWAGARHTLAAKTTATALRAWAAEKGLP